MLYECPKPCALSFIHGIHETGFWIEGCIHVNGSEVPAKTGFLLSLD